MSKSKMFLLRMAPNRLRLALIVASFAWIASSQIVRAAPDIEQAPRLTNEDFGREQFPNDYAIAVPVGEAGFYPSGAVRITAIDNLYFQKDEENQANTTQIRIIPKLDLVAEGSKSVFWGLLRGDLKRHGSDESKADVEDFRLRGFGHIDFDNRHRLDTEISYSQLSEELGTGRTRNFTDFSNVDDSDTYSLSRVGITYSYGNPRSRGELVGGVSVGQLEYDDNPIEGQENLQNFNRDMSIYWGRFSYKLTGKTTLYSRLSQRIYKYKDDPDEANRRDRDTTNFTLGANWKSTGLLYGDAAATFSSWDYKRPEKKDDDAVELTANIYWAIRSYSTANFFVRQYFDDDTSQTTVTETSTVGVRWKHAWNNRFNTTMAYYKNSDELDAKELTDRQVFSLEGRHSLRRWLNLLVGATLDDLDSDENDSSRQLVYLGIEGNL